MSFARIPSWRQLLSVHRWFFFCLNLFEFNILSWHSADWHFAMIVRKERALFLYLRLWGWNDSFWSHIGYLWHLPARPVVWQSQGRDTSLMARFDSCFLHVRWVGICGTFCFIVAFLIFVFCLRFAVEFLRYFRLSSVFLFCLSRHFLRDFVICMAGRGGLGLFLDVMVLLLSGSASLFTPCFSSLFVIAYGVTSADDF